MPQPLSTQTHTSCSTAVAHRTHYFLLYQLYICHHNRRLFLATRNKYKRVIEVANTLFAERMRRHIVFNNCDRWEYWRLSNNVLNKRELSISPHFNQVECFARTFYKNSTHDLSGVYLPNFSIRIEIHLNVMYITLIWIPQKPCEHGGIPITVFMK